MSRIPESDELEQIRRKLKKFESTLQDLLLATQEDLILAEKLQKALMPNRLVDIPGLTCHARYIAAEQVSSDSFDIISAPHHKYIYFMMSFTETHGLSSILLQSLVHLQSKNLIMGKQALGLEEIFNTLSASVADAKRAGKYRLMVCRLDTRSLEFSGITKGFCPPVRRRLTRQNLEPFEVLSREAAQNHPTAFEAAVSTAPALAPDALSFSVHLGAGDRLFLLSRDWNSQAATLHNWLEPLDLDAGSEAGTDLVDDFNYLLGRADRFNKRQEPKGDVSLVALEVDPKKLHLA